MLGLLSKLCCHVQIVLSLSFIVFMILDWYNPFMNFTGNSLSRVFLLIFCVISILNGIISNLYMRKKESVA